MKVRTNLKAGGISINHNQTAAKGVRVTRIWIVILLLVAGVTMPSLFAFSYQSKDQKAQPAIQSREQEAQKTIQSREQEAQKAIQKGIPNKIASTANNSLRNYPSPPQIRNIEDPKIRIILERGRKLLEAGKAATRWNATKLSDFAIQVDRYLKEVEAAAKSNRPKGNTPQEDCGAAKDRCNQRCHDRDASYFCFLDCRFEYAACLAGTIFRSIS
jgi:hypothetical protein